MNETSYLGFVIQAKPYQLAEDDRWAVQITISRHTGERVYERPFSSGESFDSKDEAVAHCLNFSRQIIDGKVKGCTPP